MGGHAAVDALILMPYLREAQHGAGGTGQGCALVGKGQETVRHPAHTSWTLHLHSRTIPSPSPPGSPAAHPGVSSLPAILDLRPSQALTSFIQWI